MWNYVQFHPEEKAARPLCIIAHDDGREVCIDECKKLIYQKSPGGLFTLGPWEASVSAQIAATDADRAVDNVGPWYALRPT